MTPSRRSEVKNHLYRGSARKQHLLSADIDLDQATELLPVPSAAVLVQLNVHPVIALAAPIAAELSFGKETAKTERNSSALHLISKVKKAA